MGKKSTREKLEKLKKEIEPLSKKMNSLIEQRLVEIHEEMNELHHEANYIIKYSFLPVYIAEGAEEWLHQIERALNIDDKSSLANTIDKINYLVEEDTDLSDSEDKYGL